MNQPIEIFPPDIWWEICLKIDSTKYFFQMMQVHSWFLFFYYDRKLIHFLPNGMRLTPNQSDCKRWMLENEENFQKRMIQYRDIFQKNIISENDQFDHFGLLSSQYGIFGDVGSGKTITMLSMIDSQPKENKKTLVICPPNIIPVWKQEIEKFFPKALSWLKDNKRKVNEKDELDLPDIIDLEDVNENKDIHLKVLILHSCGQKQITKVTKQDVEQADIVICSLKYFIKDNLSTLSNETRKLNSLAIALERGFNHQSIISEETRRYLNNNQPTHSEKWEKLFKTKNKFSRLIIDESQAFKNLEHFLLNKETLEIPFWYSLDATPSNYTNINIPFSEQKIHGKKFFHCGCYLNELVYRLPKVKDLKISKFYSCFLYFEKYPEQKKDFLKPWMMQLYNNMNSKKKIIMDKNNNNNNNNENNKKKKSSQKNEIIFTVHYYGSFFNTIVFDEAEKDPHRKELINELRFEYNKVFCSETIATRFFFLERTMSFEIFLQTGKWNILQNILINPSEILKDVKLGDKITIWITSTKIHDGLRYFIREHSKKNEIFEYSAIYHLSVSQQIQSRSKHYNQFSNHDINEKKSNNQQSLNPILIFSSKHFMKGWNLQSANHIVLLEPIQDSDLFYQIIGRLYRPGQEHPIFIHTLYYKETPEMEMLKKNLNVLQKFKNTKIENQKSLPKWE